MSNNVASEILTPCDPIGRATLHSACFYLMERGWLGTTAGDKLAVELMLTVIKEGNWQ